MRKNFLSSESALHRLKTAKAPVAIGEFEVRFTQKAGAFMRKILTGWPITAYKRPTCGRLGRRVSLSDDVSASMRAAG